MLAERKGSWSRFLAGFVFYPNNRKNRSFIRSFSQTVSDYFNRGDGYFGSRSVFAGHRTEHRHYATLDKSVFGVKDTDNASFISFKGDSKYDQFKLDNSPKKNTRFRNLCAGVLKAYQSTKEAYLKNSWFVGFDQLGF